MWGQSSPFLIDSFFKRKKIFCLRFWSPKLIKGTLQLPSMHYWQQETNRRFSSLWQQILLKTKMYIRCVFSLEEKKNKMCPFAMGEKNNRLSRTDLMQGRLCCCCQVQTYWAARTAWRSMKSFSVNTARGSALRLAPWPWVGHGSVLHMLSGTPMFHTTAPTIPFAFSTHWVRAEQPLGQFSLRWLQAIEVPCIQIAERGRSMLLL